MARKIRIEYAGAAYHVMARGNQGRDIYDDERDRKLWLELSSNLKKVLLICSHLQQFSKIISPPTAPCLRPNNVNGMRNTAPINHFPPTLFSPNRSPIYEEAHLFSQRARSPESKAWDSGRLAARLCATSGRGCPRLAALCQQMPAFT